MSGGKIMCIVYFQYLRILGSLLGVGYKNLFYVLWMHKQQKSNFLLLSSLLVVQARAVDADQSSVLLFNYLDWWCIDLVVHW